jgi:hypothetical protein
LYACLRLVAQGGVECFGCAVFGLCFNVRDVVLCATLMRRCEQGVADTLASGFRAHVEVFDTGEEPARGDVETVGEYGYAQYPVLRPGGQYLYFSGLDGLSQAAGEIRWHGISIPESFFEEIQGFGQARCGSDFDRAQRSMTLVAILAATRMAISI